MYAIVSTGGKQYKVAEGDVISVEKLEAQPGDKVSLDVLMLADGNTVVVEASELEGAQVEAEVLEQYKGEKVLVFKLKKRKRYHRTKGHRQNLTKLKIASVSNGASKQHDAVSEDETE